MSANLVVDLGNTTQYQLSVGPTLGVGDTPASGTIIGRIVDLLHANTYCNLLVVGGPSSGIIRAQVQVSDSVLSGSFFDPTSGMPQLPTAFQSGGIFIVNSGLWSSGVPKGPGVDSAPLFCSGGMDTAAFLRTGRYARVNLLSGGFNAPVAAGLVSQLKQVGSGTGFTYSPTSGTVNV